MESITIVPKEEFEELIEAVRHLLNNFHFPSQSKLMYSKDIQEALGCGYSTFLNLRQDMPIIKIGGKYAIRRIDFEVWLDSKKINDES